MGTTIFIKGPGEIATATGLISQRGTVLNTEYATGLTSFGCHDLELMLHGLRALLTHKSMDGMIVTINVRAMPSK
jgi:hypothetical protein